MPAKRIPIGRSDRRKVSLDPIRRSYHLHVLGGSGQGKTKFLEHCIREDILAGHGLCLIDPHGPLYEDVVAWCAYVKADRFRTIHLFDPSQSDWRFRFNPLFVHPGEKPIHRRDNVVTALAQVWGGEESTATPAIRTTLQAVLAVLIAHGYSLSEAFYLTSTADPYGIVERLTRHHSSPIMEEIWDGYNFKRKEAPREHIAEFGGVRRRLSEIMGDEEFRETFATYERPIDFRQCMDRNEIVLVNLSADAMGDDPARAFGALLVRELFYCARRRNVDQASANPFYLYLDECAGFLTDDIAKLLAQTRKFGLHAILSHQWLDQLRDASEAIYAGVMATQNKVVFGGLQDADAVVMADELFRTEYDLEIPVESLRRPGVVGYRRTWLDNWSEGESDGDVDSWAESESESESDAAFEAASQSTSQLFDQYGFPLGGYTGLSGTGTSSGSGRGRATALSVGGASISTRSSSHGSSEALEPILEVQTTAVHSLDNVRHLAVKRLRSIPARNAVVKASERATFDIATFNIRPPVIHPIDVERFKQRVLRASPYCVPRLEAKQVMDAKLAELKRRPPEGEGVSPADEDDDGRSY